jgi:hypothetical protein
MGRIKISTKKKKAVRESYIEDELDMDFNDTEFDGEQDVFDAINRNSDQFYGKTTYLDEDGEVEEESLMDSDIEAETEDSEEISKDEYQDDNEGKEVNTLVVKALRDELKKKEYQRDYLRFRYRGEVCDGVPMAEINPSKFVFKIDDRLCGVKLSEIKIL